MNSALIFDQDIRRKEWLVLVGVLAVHAGLLVLIALFGLVKVEPVVTPPAVMGVLVPATPPAEMAPRPVPVVPKPPEPKPVEKQRPALPPVKAPPSERAITTPKASEVPREDTRKTASEAAPSQPAQSTSQVAAPAQAPVIPPRTDASHLNNPAPTYPPLSRKMSEQGQVLLDVYILPDGSVGEVKLKRSSGYSRLDESAIKAVSRWRYVPARRGNEPIAYWYVQPVNFALNE